MAFEDPVRSLLSGRNFCHVGTIRKDGAPHIVPVWVDTDGEHVVLNSAEGRAWVRNVDRDPRVTCTVLNMENPYEFVQIRGRVVERTNDGADEHIDKMAQKYLNQDTYPFRTESEQRVVFKIAPDHVGYSGT